MDYSRLTLSHLVVQHCQAAGIESVVISPGSRNAPLAMDFTAYSGFHPYSIVDERSAGFFALGIVQQTRKPVALICTSGSALVNYFPAITEAYYSQLPLVVISADRPEELIDRGEGQTINQRNVFGTHVLGSVHLSNNEPDLMVASDQLATVLREALLNSGPVHINVPMDEPLYGVQPQPMNFNFEVIQNYSALEPNNLDDGLLHTFQKTYHGFAKKMILIGAMPPNTISTEVIEHWERDPSVIVLTENLANLQHQGFISGIDQVITDFPVGLVSDFKPDLLISLGGMIVSKRIKKLLRSMGLDNHWHVGFERPNDTFFALKHHLNLAPERFFSEAYKNTSRALGANTQGTDHSVQGTDHSVQGHDHSVQSPNPSPIMRYKKDWLALKEARLRGHNQYLSQAVFSDFTVHQYILAHLPHHINLQLANSASIRYAQLFPANATHHINCNRGTSGIEGSMSTAVGAAVEAERLHQRQTVFITGDLSFFYDINALWQNYTPKSFRIILINNQGGGIFRILPGAKEVAPFETFLETPHNRNARFMAQEFGFQYVEAGDMSGVKAALQSFFEPSTAPRILEVFTPSHINDQVLNAYFDYLKEHSGILPDRR